MFSASPTAIVVAIAGAFVIGARPTSSAAADPCSYLTQAQVTAALGVPMGQGRPVGTGLCTWLESGRHTGRKVALSTLTADRFAFARTPVTGVEKPAVGGVGDDAFFSYFAEPRYERLKAVDLDVKKGSSAFLVEVGGYPMEDGKAKAKLLASEVVAKM